MDKRVQQCQQLCEYFKSNYQNIPVIISGDFNEEPQNQPIKEVMESEFIDLYSQMKIQAQTYNSSDKLENHQKFTTFKYRD